MGEQEASLYLVEFHSPLQVLDRRAVAVRRHERGVLFALVQGAGLGGGEAGRARGRVAPVEVGGGGDADEQDASYGQEELPQPCA